MGDNNTDEDSRFILVDGPGSVLELQFRGPDHFRAGELHSHVESWEEILAMIRLLNNFGSCVGFGTKYRLRTFSFL